jgi:phosphatidylglycerol:prolipoprotein diacylglycerol transferase
MSYRHGTVPTPPGVRVQPTPIYETLAMGLIAWWLWRMRDRFRPGALFAFYLLLSGLERLLVEFVRRNHRIVADLTAPQLESIVLMIAGALWLYLLQRRGGIGVQAKRRATLATA